MGVVDLEKPAATSGDKNLFSLALMPLDVLGVLTCGFIFSKHYPLQPLPHQIV